MTIASTGAGHGGADPGALSKDGRTEAQITRLINKKFLAVTGVKDTTDNYGTSVNDNLARIASNINNAPNGIALSHHLNAFNGKATGVEVLYGSSDQKALASHLSSVIAKALGIVDRGAKDGSWLYLATNTNALKKVLLIEWCFIDNPSDLAKLDANMDKAVNVALEVLGYKTTNAIKNGWEKSGNEWYYYDNGVLAKNGWRQVNGKWYLFDATAKMLTGWQVKDNKWYYFLADGTMHTGWSMIKGKWYLFDKDGAMVEGWRQSGGKWYYFDADGSMKQGWFKDKSNKWYYLSVPDGEMVTGTKSINGKAYIFDKNGVCTNP